jgi:CCR4-NOT transcription complex subunit 2
VKDYNLERDFPALPVYKDVPSPQKQIQNSQSMAIRETGEPLNLFHGKIKSNLPTTEMHRSNLLDLKQPQQQQYTSSRILPSNTDGFETGDQSRRRLQVSQKTIPQNIQTVPIQNSPQPQQISPQPPQTSQPASQSPQQEPDAYGLLGLLRVLKLTDRDLNMLAFGTDLTTLGLNLSSPDALYATFSSPFSDTPLKREPEYQIPTCYYIRPPLPPPTDKMSLFSDETLFYIFYSMPRDALQIAAANELQARDWTYHTELKLWFQRSPGTTAHVKTLTHEQGSYIYFDVQHWKKRLKTNFRMDYDKLHLKS